MSPKARSLGVRLNEGLPEPQKRVPNTEGVERPQPALFSKSRSPPFGHCHLSGPQGTRRRETYGKRNGAWEGRVARRMTQTWRVRNASGSGSGSVRRLSHRPDELQRLRRGPRGGAGLRHLGPGPGARGVGSYRAARRHRCGEQGQPRRDNRGAWDWSRGRGHRTRGGAGRGT